MTTMVLLLAVLFIAIPIAELYVIVQVAQSIGVLETLALLIIVSVVGAWLVRVTGFSTLARIRRQLVAGNMPTKELVDGGIVLGAGALLIAPGFLTDVVGLLLLVPPIRIGLRTLLIRRYRRRMERGDTRVGRRGGWQRVVVDVDGTDEPRYRTPGRELEP
jgi:UPF0716 protein FxsA